MRELRGVHYGSVALADTGWPDGWWEKWKQSDGSQLVAWHAHDYEPLIGSHAWADLTVQWTEAAALFGAFQRQLAYQARCARRARVRTGPPWSRARMARR